jgi:hypothetical protein
MPREVLAAEEEITGEDEGDDEHEKDLSRTISDASFEEGWLQIVISREFLFANS